MQQAEVELPGADRLKPLIAVDVIQQYFNVRIRTSKTGDGVWDHADGGHAHKTKTDASGLASTRTPGGVHSAGSIVQDNANALQKSTAGRGEGDQSFRTYKELDANLALKPTNFLTEMGLCNAEPHRRSSEVELLGDRDEESQMSMFHRSLI
ncbi:MAG TPA: hypothetical protein VK148_04720 [Xanthobacteraceae bacterium]|nr:hypothetical protein [Xanthobacteraceae bacterium]